MDNARPPPFQSPKEFLDGTVQSFLQENTIFFETGLHFAKYIPIKVQMYVYDLYITAIRNE